MKLIFLHGVGQDSRAWDEVIAHLPDQNCRAIDLFENRRLPDNLASLQDKVVSVIKETEGDVTLVGLSLGAMLALSLLDKDLPNLKGVVAIAGQYQFPHNRAYRLQSFLFKLLPKSFFTKNGMDKDNFITFYTSLKDFDLTESLKKTDFSVLLLCGERDKINLRTAKQLKNLMPKAEMAVIAEAGHEVNKDQPLLLAERILAFVESISK